VSVCEGVEGWRRRVDGRGPPHIRSSSTVTIFATAISTVFLSFLSLVC
jgi:hypothetical protein